jgi:hypothetical protein
MMRPFIVLGLILKLYKTECPIRNKQLINLLIFSAIFCGVFNMSALFDVSLYIKLNNFWNGDARLLNDSGMTVASIAASQERYSSIFAQPATAGVAFFSMLYCILIIRKHIAAFLFFITIIFIVFGGYASKSSFFSMGLVLYIIFYIFFNIIPKSLKIISFVASMFLPTIMTYFLFSFDVSGIYLFGEDVMGARLNETSYLRDIVQVIGTQDYIFGVNNFRELGMKLGDNAILMRIILAGVLYNLLYIIALIYCLLKLTKISVPEKHFNSIFSFYATVAAGELGFTSFSQPGVVFLGFLPLILFYVFSSPPRESNASIAR